jgi:hypothetical protein
MDSAHPMGLEAAAFVIDPDGYRIEAYCLKG